MTSARPDHTTWRSNVREILLTAWDPIGIQELPATMRDANSDEYDAYVGPVVEMMLADRGERELAAYLHDVESRQMGLKPQFSRAEAAARRLAELKKRLPAAAAN